MEEKESKNHAIHPLHVGRSFSCYRDINKAIEAHRELFGLRLALKRAVKLENYCLSVEQLKDLNLKLKYGELDYHCFLDKGKPGRPGNGERCPELIRLRLSGDAQNLVVYESHSHNTTFLSSPEELKVIEKKGNKDMIYLPTDRSICLKGDITVTPLVAPKKPFVPILPKPPAAAAYGTLNEASYINTQSSTTLTPIFDASRALGIFPISPPNDASNDVTQEKITLKLRKSPYLPNEMMVVGTPPDAQIQADSCAKNEVSSTLTSPYEPKDSYSVIPVLNSASAKAEIPSKKANLPTTTVSKKLKTGKIPITDKAKLNARKMFLKKRKSDKIPMYPGSKNKSSSSQNKMTSNVTPSNSNTKPFTQSTEEAKCTNQYKSVTQTKSLLSKMNFIANATSKPVGTKQLLTAADPFPLHDAVVHSKSSMTESSTDKISSPTEVKPREKIILNFVSREENNSKVVQQEQLVSTPPMKASLVSNSYIDHHNDLTINHTAASSMGRSSNNANNSIKSTSSTKIGSKFPSELKQIRTFPNNMLTQQGTTTKTQSTKLIKMSKPISGSSTTNVTKSMKPAHMLKVPSVSKSHSNTGNKTASVPLPSTQIKTESVTQNKVIGKIEQNGVQVFQKPNSVQTKPQIVSANNTSSVFTNRLVNVKRLKKKLGRPPNSSNSNGVTPHGGIDTELGYGEKQHHAHNVLLQLLKVTSQLPMVEFSHALETLEILTDAFKLRQRVSLSISQDEDGHTSPYVDYRDMQYESDDTESKVSSTTGDTLPVESQIDGQVDSEELLRKVTHPQPSEEHSPKRLKVE